MKIAPTTRATAISGRTSQNSQCHVKRLRTNPDTVGPSAGATDITTEMTPMIEPRRLAGTTVMATVMSSGMISAVPVAWTMRPTSRAVKVGAHAATTVPTRKLVTAARNTCFVVKRCRIQPVVGMTTAMVSM